MASRKPTSSCAEKWRCRRKLKPTSRFTTGTTGGLSALTWRCGVCAVSPGGGRNEAEVERRHHVVGALAIDELGGERCVLHVGRRGEERRQHRLRHPQAAHAHA